MNTRDNNNYSFSEFGSSSLISMLRMEKKTARQRFLRRSRALTLTISIPSLSMSSSFKVDNKSESVINLKRSQSSRDVWRHKLSASENCLDQEHQVVTNIGTVSVINVSRVTL